MMNTLYWVRHGENPANITKDFSCQRVDFSLTDKGRLQAQQTAAYFRTLPPLDALYSSPMRRTLETAWIIGEALGLTPLPLEDLREINVGDLEGMAPTKENWARYDAITAAWRDGRPDLPFPGGEDFLTLRDRMMAAMMRAAGDGDGRRVLTVGHGGAFWMFLPTLCPGVTHGTLAENHNCSVTEIEVWRNTTDLTGRLMRYADVGHLSGAAARLVSSVPDAQSLT